MAQLTMSSTSCNLCKFTFRGLRQDWGRSKLARFCSFNSIHACPFVESLILFIVINSPKTIHIVSFLERPIPCKKDPDESSLTVVRIPRLLKVIHRPLEPSHQKESQRES